MSDTPTCDLDRRNCTRTAVHHLVMTAPDNGLRLERNCCSAHLSWYKRTYAEERGYSLHVTDIEETDDE